ncbi:MAG: sulfatase-like hydrolase/transferase [Bacteroidetes bacterium]|nr:sulfatase-like hydrolase/transferase [Bacteroidota bacterium]
MKYTYQIFWLIVAIVFCSCERNIDKSSPNIIIFLADDLGYADVSWNNPNAYTETPNLDKLAKSGAVFSDCYSASSMCSPSRAGLLTGRVPTRIGVHDWIKEIYKKPLSNIHLPSDEITFAELLQQKNYQTAVIGKWHLNNEFNSGNQSDPDNQGFDHWFCTPVQANPSHKNPINFYDNGVAVGKMGTDEEPLFSSQIVADKTIGWIDSIKKDLPFLLYIPFHEPHVVCDATEDIKQKYLSRIKRGEIPQMEGTGENGLGQAEYYGCIENMDAAIGRILKKLKSVGLLENTLVIFTSDNGPDSNRKYRGRLQSVGETGEFRGRKRWILEGGIRQATIMFWNGVIQPGAKMEEPVGQVDFLPTICEIAKIQISDNRTIDGVSILSLLKNEPFSRKEKPLHWHFHAPRGGPKSVLRNENWVITANWDQQFSGGRFDTLAINKIKTANLVDFKLYDIEKDAGQNNDVKENNPEVFLKLKEQIIQIHSDVKNECPDSRQFQWNEQLQEIVDTKYKSVKE